MNYEQAFVFMTSILRHLIFSDDYPIFKKLGIAAEDFPKEFVDSMRDFERLAEKNLPLAKIKFSAKFGELGDFSQNISTSTIANSYFSAAKAIRCYEFLEKVQRQPLDSERLANELLKRNSKSVKLTKLTHEVENVFKNHEASLKNGTFEILINEWEKLSKMIGGFNPGRLIVITGQTGLGKTNIALNIAVSAMKKTNVLYFNMEMLVDDVIKRIIMSKGEFSRNDFSSGNYINNTEKFMKWYSSILSNENNLLISDGRSLSVDAICSTISQENIKNKLGLVIIDYDQKIRTPDDKEQWKELHKAVEELEEIAKICEIPIILLAQEDEDERIRSSKRISQSASAQLSFKEIDDFGKKKYILEAKKNRHGINKAKLEIIYNKSMSLCVEGDYCEFSEDGFNSKREHRKL